MNVDKILVAKDKSILKQLKKEIDEIEGIAFIKAFDCDELKDFNNKVTEIIKIDFPISFTKEPVLNFFEYIKYGYDNLGFDLSYIKWLIPYFKSTKWWIEIEGFCSKQFFDHYFQTAKTSDFMFFDMQNNFLMDIENGEKCFEYRIMKY